MTGTRGRRKEGYEGPKERRSFERGEERWEEG